ncbi:MAG: HEAT repeat domain-containing protein, partial [Ktedonobacterales bacterium]
MKHADDNPTLQQLIEELQSPDVLARYAAALDLGELGDTRAVEPLIAALDDAEGYVAGAAAMALGQIGDPRAVAPLVATLESGSVTGTFMTGGVVARALGNLGEAGFQALLTIMHDYAYHEFIGEPVAFRLGKLGDPRAIPALVEALRSYVYEIHAAAGRALASFGRDALPVLVEILHAGSAVWNASLQPVAEVLSRLGELAVEPL